MQFSNECIDCLQAKAFGENYMSATNIENPKDSR